MIQDDTTLVKRVLAGEKSAFGPLIERNSICMNRMLPAGSTAMASASRCLIGRTLANRAPVLALGRCAFS
jgi:hypothetical protein